MAVVIAMFVLLSIVVLYRDATRQRGVEGTFVKNMSRGGDFFGFSNVTTTV